MQIAYLLLGSNRGDSRWFLETALEKLAALGKVVATSARYETEAWGKTDQAAFLNQALALQTPLSPQQLLHQVLEIEKTLGRERVEKYGPRTIDIDILLYGERVVQAPGLSIPHPQIPFRRFVLQCLNDIAPGVIHPQSGKTIRELLAECTDSLTVNKLP